MGRESECLRLDELLDRARAGPSEALVVRGDAGIGKTALLDYAIDRSAGMTVVRALGVESEAELDITSRAALIRRFASEAVPSGV